MSKPRHARARPRFRLGKAQRRRLLVGTAVVVTVLLGGLWLAIERVAWLGPWLADAGRYVLGADAVSRIEDWKYGVEDRWNGWWRRDEKPVAHWTVPLVATAAAESAPRAIEADAGRAGLEAFRPSNVGPLFKAMCAPGDGVWTPVVDPAHPDDATLYKTLIHPDRNRNWAELYVVAIDLRRLGVFAVAGTVEPEASTSEGQRYVRRGLVPDERRDALVAVFNGGFKATNGHWGMKVDDVTLLPPRNHGCTFAAYSDGTLRIGTWTALASEHESMTWFRQTPSCMVENGRLHPGLADEDATHWGSALSGETVVRRSAIGLNADRTILYMGLSNSTTARALALGMQHAGASDVAQLDINWSYPHFVMFKRSESGTRAGFSLFDGFVCDERDYVSRASTRDFFYLIRKAPQ